MMRKQGQRSCLRLLVLATSCASTCLADFLPAHSFAAPFNLVQSEGKRIVNKEWSVGGTAQVNQNFVRLTPDRQSRKGALWSDKALGVADFTSTMKFRIHGQGKKFFGDGIGYWITTQPFWVDGDLHGVSSSFTGVGVVFDTFKNTEQGAKHRDVAVYVNDGTKKADQLIAEFEGCDASIRYHGERADFSITNATKAKMTLEGNSFSVMIDAKSNGNWFTCVTVELPLEEGWARNAHIGITASTGQLADNHDIVALSTYDDLEIHPEADSLVTTPKFDRGFNLSVEARAERLEDMMSRVLDLIDEMQAHGEHQLVAVQDHISAMIRKLQAQEDKSEARIANLEEQIIKTVQGTMDQRLTHLENSLQTSMARKVAQVENNIQSTMQKVAASDWKLPLFMVLLLIGACMIVIYRWYNKLRKSHIF